MAFLNAAPSLSSAMRPASVDRLRRRAPYVNASLIGSVALIFTAMAAQLVRIGLNEKPHASVAISETVATSFSRPDIVDRNGRLLATDIAVPSLYADPAIVLDRDEVAEKLATVLPDLDRKELRDALADRSRRFVWIRRGLSPAVAQEIHDLGLPGLAFRKELRRAYPGGKLAGHILGAVNVDNRGTAGIERYIDDAVGVDPVSSATLSSRPPVRLSIDMGIQHALEDELERATRTYKTKSAAGLILDIKTGEVLASSSLPRIDPLFPATSNGAEYADKNTAGTFEMGSVFKTLTLAMAFDEGIATPATLLNVQTPLEIGKFTIKDMHGSGRPLTAKEVFTHSSNVGAGMLALKAGAERQRDFLKKSGLLAPLKLETGMTATPQLPERWGEIEQVTIAYGHGIAVAPIQFAAATASILNRGVRVTPTLLKGHPANALMVKRIVSPQTSAAMASLFRHNVIDTDGTGKRADVPGFRVGGKTGTAELAEKGGYEKTSVLSSFVAAFPMDDPHYLTLIMLWEPKASDATRGHRTASVNAAPVTADLITRVAGELGVAPTSLVAAQ